MSTREMMMVFCYDISSDKARRKVAASLEVALTRVQHSVFEGRMTQSQADALAKRAGHHLKDGDSLRVYAIGANGLRRSKVIGSGAPFEPREGYWLL